MNAWRPRIEHAQIFHPRDLERIGKLGGWLAHCDRVSTDQTLAHSHCERTADARVRPLFSWLKCEDIESGYRTSDMSYAEKRLVSWTFSPCNYLRNSNTRRCLQGQDRIKGAYAFQTLLQYFLFVLFFAFIFITAAAACFL